jgi:hypothetical protein
VICQKIRYIYRDGAPIGVWFDAVLDLLVWPNGRVVHQLETVEVWQATMVPVCELGLGKLGTDEQLLPSFFA